MHYNEMSVPALAYLGDSVLELITREMLCQRGISDAGKLNKMALDYVRATAQSKAVDNMLPHLDENELSCFKRGRNHHTASVPKSASAVEYRKATGLEVLFACLHLQGKQERMRELYKIGFEELTPNN